MTASELSRPFKLRPLPGDTVKIEADLTERAALAERFGLSAVERLQAEIDLEEDGKAVRATGRLLAKIVQICAISGEDFPVEVNEPVELRFVEEGTHAGPSDETEEIEIELASDDCDEIEYTGDSFDLGEAIAQTLGLAIDPYAEGPHADTAREAAGLVREGKQLGPLADALSGLKKP